MLGSLELCNDDGRELRSVLVQPKRAALLAYLAAAAPAGFHRRDRLLALTPRSYVGKAAALARAAADEIEGAAPPRSARR